MANGTYTTPPKSYCSFVQDLPPDNVHRIYHDTEYGMPVTDDSALFELLLLEINQAGLSWNTILNKRENFRRAYDQYQITVIAGYGDTDKERLLRDAGIIRNRKKVEAAIHNAGVVLKLQKEYGSFHQWLQTNHPKTHAEWTSLFRKTFRFTGPEIVNEFLMSAGYLPGAHWPGCPVYPVMVKTNPPFLNTR
jgi:DNA-3-methyladenine glycosylase I